MTDADVDFRPPQQWRRWLGLGLVAALLFCTTPVALGVLAFDRVSRAVEAGEVPGATRSPRPGDPPEVRRDWFAARLRDLLDQQAAALLRGDEAGFLAVVHPNEPRVTRDLRRQFRTLRALRVARWQPELRHHPIQQAEPGEWVVQLTIRYCFLVQTCAPSEVELGTRWIDIPGQPRLIEVDPPPSTEGRPRPWEVSELVVSVGQRVLVATTPDLRGRLPKLLAEAERAATVADRYAVRGSPPHHYHVFYAGRPEWRRWYLGDTPDWVAGYAVSTGGDGYDVVLNSRELADGQLDDLLRHELTHVASLHGASRTSDGTWWLVEGLAEHAAAGARPVHGYEGLSQVTRLLDEGGWNGELDQIRPGRNAADWQVAGSYGVGYLAVRYLVDRYGEPALLTFFKHVVHDGRAPEDAARAAFAADWSVLHDECVAYLRRVAR